MDLPSLPSTTQSSSDSYSESQSSGFQGISSNTAERQSKKQKTLKFRVSGSQRVVCFPQLRFGTTGSHKD